MESFQEATNHVKAIKVADDNDKLMLYALFKFATKGEGPVDPRPSAFSMTDRAKVKHY